MTAAEAGRGRPPPAGAQGPATVLVTGASGGLGGAVTEAFLVDGWRVVAASRSGRPAGVTAGPDRLQVVAADLDEPADVAATVAAATADATAPLRALVNLVGGFTEGGRVHETPVEDLERQLALNLRPTWLVTKAALPHLVAAGGGAVVCMSSRSAVAPFRGAAGYAAAKAAVLAFAQAVAVEYRADGVRCNAVLPSVIDTPANRAKQPDADWSRWVPPQQVAAVIRFLCGEESAPTSGAAIPVYGRA
ncbi:MAG TPA: SDR family NAD(P)-dependent oxidoreductase [Actinomycetota bacterium]|jgi:NAD(P)-dependent dehydrogenase (short-subunit alcohol dehydrogenase family)|nr:SDR family NAD(P)-dependent oxidoreductase [Actinomycetota bacterium]